MSRFLTLLQHELGVLWRTASMIYILILSWTLLFCLTFFWGNFLGANQASFDVMFSYHAWVYLFLISALSMFAWTEEMRRKTWVHLVHYPVSMLSFVGAKYIVQLSVVLVFLLGTVPFALMVMWLGNPDLYMYMAGFLGSLILGAFFLAVGQISSVCAKDKPLIAFVLTFLLNISVIYLLPQLGAFILVEDFYRQAVFGFLNISEALFIFLGVFLCLSCSAFLLARRFHKSTLSGALISIFIIFLGVGSLFLPTKGIDLTEEKKHTLDEGTRDFLRDLEGAVVLTFYTVRDQSLLPPQFKKYLEYSVRYLENFAQYSDKVTLEIKYIDDAAEIEFEAKEKGAVPFSTVKGETFVLALGVESERVDGILPQLSPDRAHFLEFDIVSLVQEVSRSKVPQIGIMTEMNVGVGAQQRPQFIDALLSKYGVKSISPYEPFIDKEIDLLIVFQTPTMSRESLYALDQYLVSGGKAIVFLDPFFRNAPSDDLRAADRNADAKELDHPADLLRLYGVEYDYNLIVGSNALAMPVQINDVGLTHYPLWLNLGQEHINNNLPISQNIRNVVLVESGFFDVNTTKVDGAKLVVTPLLTTGNYSQYVVREDLLSVSPQGVAEVLRGVEKRRDLALHIKGSVPSLFEDVPPFVRQYYEDYSEVGAEVLYPEHRLTSDAAAELVVFGDIDFLADEYIQPSKVTGDMQNHNMVLFFNVVQDMLGEGVLLPLRLKSSQVRPFTGIDQFIETESKELKRLEAQVGEQLLRLAMEREALEKRIEEGGKASLSQEAQLKALDIKVIELERQMRSVQSVLPHYLQKMGLTFMSINFILPALVVILGWLCYLWRRSCKIKKV